MPIETIPWTVQDHIVSEQRQRDYLEAAFEDGDPALIAAAIEDVVRARGLDAAASSDRAFAKDPRLSTVLEAMKALGLSLAVKNVHVDAA